MSHICADCEASGSVPGTGVCCLNEHVAGTDFVNGGLRLVLCASINTHGDCVFYSARRGRDEEERDAKAVSRNKANRRTVAWFYLDQAERALSHSSKPAYGSFPSRGYAAFCVGQARAVIQELEDA